MVAALILVIFGSWSWLKGIIHLLWFVILVIQFTISSSCGGNVLTLVVHRSWKNVEESLHSGFGQKNKLHLQTSAVYFENLLYFSWLWLEETQTSLRVKSQETNQEVKQNTSVLQLTSTNGEIRNATDYQKPWLFRFIFNSYCMKGPHLVSVPTCIFVLCFVNLSKIQRCESVIHHCNSVILYYHLSESSM